MVRGLGMAPIVGAALDGRHALMLCVASLLLITFTRVLAVAVCHLTKNRFRPVIYSYAAALEGVPSVFLSGDKNLCETSKRLHPRLVTCPVKEGCGGATVNYNPKAVLKWIKEGVKTALNQDLRSALPNLPQTYELEICYKKTSDAEKF